MEKTKEGACPGSTDLESLLKELTAIRGEMVDGLAMSSARIEKVHANYQDSARNLLHYLALRRHNLCPLQIRLAALGLSSLV
jgi:pyruvate kinase